MIIVAALAIALATSSEPAHQEATQSDEILLNPSRGTTYKYQVDIVLQLTGLDGDTYFLLPPQKGDTTRLYIDVKVVNSNSFGNFLRSTITDFAIDGQKSLGKINNTDRSWITLVTNHAVWTEGASDPSVSQEDQQWITTFFHAYYGMDGATFPLSGKFIYWLPVGPWFHMPEGYALESEPMVVYKLTKTGEVGDVTLVKSKGYFPDAPLSATGQAKVRLKDGMIISSDITVKYREQSKVCTIHSKCIDPK